MTRRISRLVAHLSLTLLMVLCLSGCWNSGTPEAPGPSGTPESDPVPTKIASPTTIGHELTSLRTRGATVSRVVDGDTITVEPSGSFPATYNCYEGQCKEHAVRILGIDSPEMNTRSPEPTECGAQEATDALAELLLSEDEGLVVIIAADPAADTMDRYGRSLAYVIVEVDGEPVDVGAQQVVDGHARPYYPEGEPEPIVIPHYQPLHDQARHEGLGLHSCPAYH